MRLAVLLTMAMLAAGLVALSRAAAPGRSVAPEAMRVRVLDGDTLVIGGTVVRLHGIDAPEAAQRCGTPGGGSWACGAAAHARLEQMMAGRQVACAPRDVDRYGRTVAVCTAEGRDLGAALVAEGLAWAYRYYAEDYVGAERQARGRGVGIWQAATLPAWDWRAERAANAAPVAGLEG